MDVFAIGAIIAEILLNGDPLFKSDILRIMQGEELECYVTQWLSLKEENKSVEKVILLIKQMVQFSNEQWKYDYEAFPEVYEQIMYPI